MGWFRDVFGFSGQDLFEDVVEEVKEAIPREIREPVQKVTEAGWLGPVLQGATRGGRETLTEDPLGSLLKTAATAAGGMGLYGLGGGALAGGTGAGTSPGLLLEGPGGLELGGLGGLEFGGGAGVGFAPETATFLNALTPGAIGTTGAGGWLATAKNLLSKAGTAKELLNMATGLFKGGATPTAEAGEAGVGYGAGWPYGVQYYPPGAPQYPTAPELIQAAMEWARTQYPKAYGAREEALRRIGEDELEVGPEFYDPFKIVPETPVTPEYFEQWGPTSFEDVLASKAFERAYRPAERAIAHRMSLQGMGTSPITAELMGKRAGEIGVDIGQILANLGQRRAELGLTEREQLRRLGQERARLGLAGREAGLGIMAGITPYSTFQPYLTTDIAQQMAQAGAGYQEAQQAAEERLRQDILGTQRKEAYRRTRPWPSLIGGLGGWGLGEVLDIPGLAQAGSTIGSTVFGGPDIGELLGQTGKVQKVAEKFDWEDLFKRLNLKDLFEF